MIAEAEELKQQLTDKYVVVHEGVPELRRFVGLTGQVKTVNMNGRALVQFDNPVDISWYDIDPGFLTVVDAPLPKEKPGHAESKSSAKVAPAPVKPAASAGESPIDRIRKQQGAPAPAAAGAKLSPLEKIRQQQAAKQGGTDAPAPADAPAADADAGLSPLERIRRQQAAKTGDAAPATAPQASEPAAVPTAPDAPPPQSSVEPTAATEAPPASSASTADEDLSGLSIIERIRRQGAAKQ